MNDIFATRPDNRITRPEELTQDALVELLAQYNALAREAARTWEEKTHDTWHRAMDLALAAAGNYNPAPCFCSFGE